MIPTNNGDEMGKWSRAFRQYDQIHLRFHFLECKNHTAPALFKINWVPFGSLTKTAS